MQGLGTASRTRRFLVCLPFTLTALLALLGSGCSKSGPPMGRVSGKVTVKGAPLTKGTITFVPTDAARPNATSLISVDGAYNLQSREPGDGAELGDYQVVVSSVGNAEILDYIPKGKDAKKTAAIISPKYESADTSGLKATVKSGGNTFDFDLEP